MMFGKREAGRKKEKEGMGSTGGAQAVFTGKGNSIDVEKLKEIKKELEAIFDLDHGQESEKYRELKESLKNYFDAWTALHESRIRYEAADMVLRAYYRQGRILDYLEKLDRFAGKIDENWKSSDVRLMGYNNYIFFLRIFMRELREEYGKARQKEEPDIERGMDSVKWFIKNECQNTVGVKDMPDTRKKAKTIIKKVEKAKREKTVTLGKSDYQSYRDVIAAWELINEACKEDRRILEEHQREVKIRQQRLGNEIRKGQGLFTALDSLLTEEWFDRLDPEKESNPINYMSVSEIRKLYCQCMEEINNKILKVYPRSAERNVWQNKEQDGEKVREG